MEAHFIVVQKSGNPKKFKLSDNEYVILGRSAKASQVKLDDDLCSSRHCKISLKSGSIIVEDLESKNGVYLNGVRILKQKLYINDKVKFGHTTIYINPKRMDDASVEKCTYRGQTEIRGVGNLTLELDGIKTAKSKQTNNHLQVTPIVQSARKVSRQRASANTISHNKNTAPSISQKKLDQLNFLSKILDLIIACVVFYITIHALKKAYPSLNELAQSTNFLKFLFEDKMLPFSGASAFCAFLSYRINRKIPGGSIGDRLLGIKQ